MRIERRKWTRLSVWAKKPAHLMHIVEQICKYHPNSHGVVYKMVEKGGYFAVYTKPENLTKDEEKAHLRKIKEEMLGYI